MFHVTSASCLSQPLALKTRQSVINKCFRRSVVGSLHQLGSHMSIPCLCSCACPCACRQHILARMHVHSCSTISISMFMLRYMRIFGSCTRCWSSRVGSHVCVHALVYVSMCMSLGVVGGFEEDRASRRLGDISDGWFNCVPSCPLSHHGECVLATAPPT